MSRVWRPFEQQRDAQIHRRREEKDAQAEPLTGQASDPFLATGVDSIEARQVGQCISASVLLETDINRVRRTIKDLDLAHIDPQSVTGLAVQSIIPLKGHSVLFFDRRGHEYYSVWQLRYYYDQPIYVDPQHCIGRLVLGTLN